VHAASAIEIALWDLAGKAAGVPVYKLLGGKHRDQVRLYNCVGFYETYLEMEDVYKEMGTTILKFDITPAIVSNIPGARMDQHLTRKGLNRIVGVMEEIRDRVDDDIEVSVEARTGTVANALRFLKAVEPFDLTWAEDLIGPTDVNAWVTLTQATTVPTLTGEGLHMRQEFLPYYEKGAARIMSPDFQVCGGLSEGKKICELADLHHMLVCPHMAASAIGVVAAVHACAAIPNLLALEFHAMPGWDRILAGYSPQIKDGFIEVPEGPGLGVELDHDETRRYVMRGESYFE
jgi:L-alanine-DL-glutamate epimerase-like enolase superfamily enzyme